MKFLKYAFDFSLFFEAKEPDFKNITVKQVKKPVPNNYHHQEMNIAAYTIVKELQETKEQPAIASRHKFELAATPLEVKTLPPSVTVSDQNCLDAVTELLPERRNKIAMLNMANRHMVGGNVFNGSLAQEERLFVTTDIGGSLLLYAQKMRGYQAVDRNGNNRPHYNKMAFHPTDVLYSSNIIKYELDDALHLKELPSDQYVAINIITSSALQYDKEQKKYYESSYENNETLCKTYEANVATTVLYQAIYNQISTIIASGNTAAVLSAFGCGAFKNDPRVISKIYRDILCLPEFFGRLTVRFAVLKNNANKNFEVFAETFSTPLVLKPAHKIKRVYAKLDRTFEPIPQNNEADVPNYSIAKTLLQFGFLAVAANRYYKGRSKQQEVRVEKPPAGGYIRSKL